MSLSTVRLLSVIFVSLLTSLCSHSQSITEQKESVAFVFGTIHPLKPDKTAIKDAQGHRIAVEMALGTGFFVGYPDVRIAPEGLTYFVTAKHVLRDPDGTFLHSVRLRLNLQDQNSDPGFDFIDVPVTDANGRLLWLHSDNNADDVVLTPVAVDRKFALRLIPTSVFVNDATLKSNAVEEGDNLYFIGLMAQYYGSKRNFPVIRRGTLALMTDEKIQTPTGEQQAFIAELQSWPGNSGSPVFLNLGGLRGSGLLLGQKLNLLGILAGGFLNQISGNVVDEAQQLRGGTDAEIGVSYIVPAMRISELLDSVEARIQRETNVRIIVRQRQQQKK